MRVRARGRGGAARRWARWTWWVGLALLIGFRVAAPEATIERIYGLGVYPVVQGLLRVAFGWWPLPAMYVWFVGLALCLTAIVRKVFREDRRSRWGTLTVGLACVGSVILAWFLLGWGINYGRVDLPVRLGLRGVEGATQGGGAARDVRLTTDQLVAEFERQIAVVNASRRALAGQGLDPMAPIAGEVLQAVGESAAATVDEFGYRALPVRRMRVLPEGQLLRWGTAGVFSPWTGDPHLDGGLHPMQVPFVAAHEWGHAQGITDEGECNLLAFIVCMRSDNPLVRYAAEIGYLRYLRGAVARNAPDRFRALHDDLDPLVASDLEAIRRQMDRFEEVAPVVRDAVYDRYLKTQGVADGAASYARLIDWVVAARGLPRPLWQTADARAPSRDSSARGQ